MASVSRCEILNLQPGSWGFGVGVFGALELVVDEGWALRLWLASIIAAHLRSSFACFSSCKCSLEVGKMPVLVETHG